MFVERKLINKKEINITYFHISFPLSDCNSIVLLFWIDFKITEIFLKLLKKPILEQ